MGRENLEGRMIAEMESYEVLGRISYMDLERYTDSFSKENFIANFQFGKVYRGTIHPFTGPKHLLVKIWEHPEIYGYDEGDNEDRLKDEIMLLEHEKLNFHPCLSKLFAYCWEGEKLGIVYRFEPLDTVHNLLPKDSFTWLQRITVAVRVAYLLRFFHGHNPMNLPFLIRNISAAHIMLDKDYNPKLIDFGMISGGIFPDRTTAIWQHVWGCYGYVDPHYCYGGSWSEKCDVFAFGVVLWMLITKNVYNEEDRSDPNVLRPEELAQKQYKLKKGYLGFFQSGCSLVHKTLEAEQGFCSSDGPKITKLAMQCVEYYPWRRPTMKKVVKCLQNLRVVRHHAISLPE